MNWKMVTDLSSLELTCTVSPIYFGTMHNLYSGNSSAKDSKKRSKIVFYSNNNSKTQMNCIALGSILCIIICIVCTV